MASTENIDFLEYAERAVRHFTPSLYLEAKGNALSKRKFVSAMLMAVSWVIEEGRQSDGTKKLVGIFTSLRPKPIPYNAAAKSALIKHLRMAAMLIESGAVDYSAPPRNTTLEGVIRGQILAPKIMKNICNELQNASKYVRDWIDKQPNVKEESLTDWLLYEVSNRANNIKYAAFTRHEEARTTGADWEWWIVFSDFSYRFRVQAKKAFPGIDNYPSLAHTNRHGLQLDKLLSDAKTTNAIAMYAFYSAEKKTSMCDGIDTSKDAQDGVFLASAKRISKDLMSGPRMFIKSGEILARTNPFSCFACCPLISPNGKFMDRYLRQYYPEETESESDHMNGKHLKLPAYISSLLDQEKQPLWWESEFKSERSSFNSILIYDFRAESNTFS